MEKKYYKGFTAGVFDLFHVGHLNLLKSCKNYCEYLMVGVLTDEYAEYLKGKKPYICLADRMDILKSIRYVDEVVPVDFHNTFKPDAWKLYHFDCCFSGNDHEKEKIWQDERKVLQQYGSEMIFLPYTTRISSSKIKEDLKKR